MPPVASLLLAPWEQRRQVPRAAEHGQAAAVATRSRWDSVDLAGAPLDTVVARVAAAVKPDLCKERFLQAQAYQNRYTNVNFDNEL